MPWFFEPTPAFNRWLEGLEIGMPVSLANAHTMRTIPSTQAGCPVQSLTRSRVLVAKEFYSRKTGLYMPPYTNACYSFDSIARIVPVGFQWSLHQEIVKTFEETHGDRLGVAHVEITVGAILSRLGDKTIGSNALIELALQSLEDQVFVNPDYLGTADLSLGSYLRQCHGAREELHMHQHPWVPRSVSKGEIEGTLS